MSASLYSIEERMELVGKFLASGSSNQAEFCRNQGLVYNTFKHWIIVYEKLFSKEDIPTSPLPLSSSIKEDSFVSLKIENEQNVTRVEGSTYDGNKTF